MRSFIRVQSVTPAAEYRVYVVFTNGEEREIDLTPYITTGPVFESIRSDPAIFSGMRVEGGTIAWPNGADIDPDVLYYNGTPPWAQPPVPTTAESEGDRASK